MSSQLGQKVDLWLNWLKKNYCIILLVPYLDKYTVCFLTLIYNGETWYNNRVIFMVPRSSFHCIDQQKTSFDQRTFKSQCEMGPVWLSQLQPWTCYN